MAYHNSEEVYESVHQGLLTETLNFVINNFISQKRLVFRFYLFLDGNIAELSLGVTLFLMICCTKHWY